MRILSCMLPVLDFNYLKFWTNQPSRLISKNNISVFTQINDTFTKIALKNNSKKMNGIRKFISKR